MTTGLVYKFLCGMGHVGMVWYGMIVHFRIYNAARGHDCRYVLCVGNKDELSETLPFHNSPCSSFTLNFQSTVVIICLKGIGKIMPVIRPPPPRPRLFIYTLNVSLCAPLYTYEYQCESTINVEPQPLPGSAFMSVVVW